ncbi:TipAS antibiotic-recognition domain-containing protein [Dictyobacter kobayashii]|uniref:TipAS antibiotic-recognition domain-containing protein n=1 Tax=Dictyobacter kobayashii TaxID=2014872 RepID=A0A402AQE3_9CHLR|nr:TipAS antibiotic-recognition domain-containing protein [Dictyobacter kobayashii]GCE21312.1 hypothetical protein KDK_51120 [Dictyobacter kobayashii]
MSEPLEEYNPTQYYTQEQLDYLSNRQSQLGYERVTQILEEWEQLRTQLRADLEQGLAPSDERVRPLATKLVALKAELVGDPAEFREDFAVIQEKSLQDLLAIDPAEGKLLAYTNQAMEAASK